MCGCQRALQTPSNSTTEALPKAPTLEYARWQSKGAGYEILVTGVYNKMKPDGESFYSRVVVQGTRTSPTKRVSWPMHVFLESFEPLGPKIRIQSRWERISQPHRSQSRSAS